jgi:hypothetical protein
LPLTPRSLTTLVVAFVVVFSAACGGEESASEFPFEERFAEYEPAPEPNVDASTVEWPSFVTKARPEVKRLYAYALEHGDLLRYIPCYCGCGGWAGHRSNRDCYVRRVNADGGVVFDSMAPT